jgi:hypothetical protein
MDVRCENCGRTRRLTSRHIAEYERRGHRSIEQIGEKLRCSACDERGRVSRNVSVVPYFRRHGPAQSRSA